MYVRREGGCVYVCVLVCTCTCVCTRVYWEDLNRRVPGRPTNTPDSHLSRRCGSPDDRLWTGVLGDRSCVGRGCVVSVSLRKPRGLLSRHTVGTVPGPSPLGRRFELPEYLTITDACRDGVRTHCSGVKRVNPTLTSSRKDRG